MSTVINAEMVDLIAIVPGQDAQEISVPRGSTVADVAASLGLSGAARLSALNASGEAMGPNSTIDEDTEVLSFIYRLAGA